MTNNVDQIRMDYTLDRFINFELFFDLSRVVSLRENEMLKEMKKRPLKP